MSTKGFCAVLVSLVFALAASAGVCELAIERAGRFVHVKKILEEPAKQDFTYQSPFFTALTALAKGQRIDLSHFILLPGKKTRCGLTLGIGDNARALPFFADGKDYILVIAQTSIVGAPQSVSESSILLDSSGRFLDRVACGTGSECGRLRTEIIEAKGELVIRLNPVRNWCGWHSIAFEGLPYSFFTETDAQRAECEEKGLCRLRIKNGKFRVTYPVLGKPD